jgi:rhodopsin domain-containing protein
VNNLELTSSFNKLLAWGFIGCTIAGKFVCSRLLAFCLTLPAVQRGLGSHFVEVEARGTENMIAYLQFVWLSSIFYNACLGFIKVSVLALYMRLGDRLLRRLAIGMLGVIICQAGANVLACIFQCSPIKAAYDITVPPEDVKCVNINAFYLANAAVNIFTDVLTYSLPIPMLVRLQIPRRQKVGLCVILGLGLL